MKPKKKLYMGLTSLIILIILIGIGGKYYMDNKRFNDEMINVVKSDQAKKIFEENLKYLDSNALTSEGIIQSYEIDYARIKHNPMGGIMTRLIINNNKELYVNITLSKYSDSELEESGGGFSVKLMELLNIGGTH